MISTLQSLLPLFVVIFHIFLVVSLLALIFRTSFGAPLVAWAGEHALALGLALGLITVGGSLFYSNGVGFEPCYLCWWQRVALYPMLVLFITALINRDRSVFAYVFPLSLIALILATYHSYVQWGGTPLVPCDVTASCAKLYVYAFGYVTIPTMSLTMAVAFLLLTWANKVYRER